MEQLEGKALEKDYIISITGIWAHALNSFAIIDTRVPYRTWHAVANRFMRW